MGEVELVSTADLIVELFKRVDSGVIILKREGVGPDDDFDSKLDVMTNCSETGEGFCVSCAVEMLLDSIERIRHEGSDSG